VDRYSGSLTLTVSHRVPSRIQHSILKRDVIIRSICLVSKRSNFA